MADDIDIEEHDVLDHPRIKDMLPELEIDLGHIKVEVSDDDVQEHDLDEENYEYYDSTNMRPSMRQTLTFEDEEDCPPTHNKIILGSKPCPSTSRSDDGSNPILSYLLGHNSSQSPLVFGSDLHRTIKIEPVDFDEGYSRSPVIILGSKPNRETFIEIENVERDIYSAVVDLEDWGPRLNRSKCYCKECEILFPTRNCLDGHKATAHSFLVALDTDHNRAVKSTSKTQITARKSTVNEPTTSKAKFCNHCSKTFPDDSSLIKHLYEILPFDKFKCNECDAVFKKDADLKSHVQFSHNRSESESSDSYFSCRHCSCFFKYKASYQRHVLDSHEDEVIDTKKWEFDGQCPVCASIFSYKYYNQHIRDVHANLFLKKVNSSSNAVQTPKLQKSVTKFPQKSTSQTQSKFSPNNVQKPPLRIPQESSYVVYKNVSNPPIPKDILFKCNQCQIHFTNCSAAVIHSRNCLQYKGDWKCQECRRSFKLCDKLIHQRQHQVSESFVVYVINETLYGSVLCQCPDCKTYLHEQDFWLHCKVGCRLTQPSDCDACGLSIHHSSMDVHKQWHRDLEITRNDFILIEFDKGNLEGDTKAVKRKLDRSDVDAPPPKLIRLKNDFLMYYCAKCNYCTKGNKNAHHLAGNCVSSVSKTRRICKLCGLMISTTKHALFHKRNPRLKLSDIKFVRLQDRKTVPPPVPTYPKCTKCLVNFISLLALGRHECIDSYKTCKYCGERFSDLAYKLHVPFHEYNKTSAPKYNNKDITVKPKKIQQKTPQKTPQKSPQKSPQKMSQNTQNIPELLQKYQQLTKTWNILYLCHVCDIVCDSYDKMIEHCQNHFNKMESYDMTVKECHACDLQFDGSCFDKHQDLHTTNDSINKYSFDIFTYDYTKLFSADWLELFGDLPKAQVQKIVSRSIYSPSRQIKMRVIIDGPPECTVYKCARCEKYVNPVTLHSHHEYASCCKNYFYKFPCNICRLIFTSHRGRTCHMADHKTGKETFRHVLINQAGDEDFNKALGLTYLKDSRDQSEYQRSSTNKSKFLYTYYQCSNCECCVKRSDCRLKHVCGTLPRRKRRCPKCNLYFVNPRRHLERHAKIPKYVRKNFNIVVFNPKTGSSNDTVKVAKLYKCTCGLHFTSYTTIEKHMEVCSPNNAISKENCSKCGLLFPTHVLVSHLCSHHSNDKYCKIEVEMVKPKTRNTQKTKNCTSLFKCRQCDICYMSLKTLRCHYEDNHRTGIKHKCTKCGQNFTKYSLTKHIAYHHKRFKCKAKDINVEEVMPGCFSVASRNSTISDAKPDTQSSKKSIKSFKLSPSFLATLDWKSYGKKLFKCTVCRIHMMSYGAYASHVLRDHKSIKKREITSCHICGLSFSYQTLPRHIFVHHDKMHLKRKDFRIVIMKPRALQTPSEPEPKMTKPLSKLMKSSMSTVDYNRRLYKCIKCNAHFLVRGSLKTHKQRANRCIKNLSPCAVCGLEFSKPSLERHMFIHHEKMNLSREDFIIKTSYYSVDNKSDSERVSEDDNEVTNDSDVLEGKERAATPTLSESDFDDNKTFKDENEDASTDAKFNKSLNNTELYRLLFQCEECLICSLTWQNLSSHMRYRRHDDPKVECSYCHLMFHPPYLSRHQYVHHTKLNLRLEDIIIIPSSHLRTKAGTYNNFIYECGICSVNFLTAKTFSRHLELCDKMGTRHKSLCKICGIVFSPRALNIHTTIQHEQMNLQREDFQIIKYYEAANPIAIRNDSMIESGRNIDAELNEGATTNKDKSMDVNDPLDMEEFILPDDADDLSLAELRSNAEETSTDVDGKNVLSLKLYNNCLFKCKMCSTHVLKETTMDSHISRSCSGPKSTCSDCGLVFGASVIDKHKEVHHLNRGLRVEDFLVIECTSIDGNAVKNCLFKCSVCLVHYVREDSLDEHPCKRNLINDDGKVTTCKLCGYAFCVASLSRHKFLHHGRINFKRDDFHIIVNDDNKNELKITADETPDLTEQRKVRWERYTLSEQYKSSIDISLYENKLYKCNKCELHFMILNTLTRHRDLCQFPHKPVSAGKCQTCGLRFTAISLARHEYIHHEKLGLKLEDLRILDDDEIEEESNDDRPKKRGKASCIEVSKIENKTHRMRNLNKTEYNYIECSNTFKAQCDPNLYGNRLYMCNVCSLHFLLPSSASCHRHQTSNKTVCSTCGLKFTPHTLGRHQYIHHERLKLILDDFEIVNYQTGITIKQGTVFKPIPNNYNSENDTNMTDESVTDCIPPKMKAPTKKFKSYTLSSQMTKRLNLKMYNNFLYKCGTCSLHYLNYANVRKHESSCDNSISHKRECDVCGLEFSFSLLAKHMYVHHTMKKLDRDDLEVVNRPAMVVTIKKTEIGETYDVEPSTSKDDVSNDGTGAVKDETDDMVIDTDNIDAVILDDADAINAPKEIIDNKLYRCNKCYVHFFNYEKLDCHVENSAHKVLRRECTKCGLAFPITSVATHVDVQHSKLGLKLEDFQIISKPHYANHQTVKNPNSKEDVVDSQSNDHADSSIDDSSKDLLKVDVGTKNETIKLYKCGICNVYFLSQASCYKHTSKHTALDSKDYIECKLCDFQFRILSLHKHIVSHHSKDFNLENVLIEEYQPNVLSNGTPKIHIYYAKDKVQSRLVSTTSEVSSREVDTTEIEDVNQSEDGHEGLQNEGIVTNDNKFEEKSVVSCNIEKKNILQDVDTRDSCDGQGLVNDSDIEAISDSCNSNEDKITNDATANVLSIHFGHLSKNDVISDSYIADEDTEMSNEIGVTDLADDGQMSKTDNVDTCDLLDDEQSRNESVTDSCADNQLNTNQDIPDSFSQVSKNESFNECHNTLDNQMSSNEDNAESCPVVETETYKNEISMTNSCNDEIVSKSVDTKLLCVESDDKLL